MNLHKKLLCTAGVALLLSSTSLYAEDKSARDILNKAYQYVGSMDTYSFTALVSKNEGLEANVQTVSVKIDRPNNFRVDSTGKLKNRTNYLHDGSFTMMDHGHNYYGQIKTPKTIDGTLDVLFEKFGIRASLAQLMYSDMDKRVRFKTSKYFGTKEVAGIECDYIAFKNGTREVHAWIATGDAPLVQSYSIMDTNSDGVSRINASLTWKKNPNISDSDFVFVAPKGASKISVNPAQ